MKTANTDLAYYRSLAAWHPIIGDNVVWHGWLTHWFGIINYIEKDGNLGIIKSGLPILLVSMSTPQMDKNNITIHLSEIQNSIAGKFAIIRAENNNIIWYV